MAGWVNHVAIAAPRNGTTAHNGVDPAGGTVVAGSNFTPTAGRFLVCVCEGAVTSTTPSGWSLGGSAVNMTGLYVWYRVAAGGDTVSTTHNSSNYPAVFDFYEYQFDGSWVNAVGSTGVAYNGGAGPTLSGLSGTNFVAASMGQDLSGTGSATVTWSNGTESVDTYTAFATTDGYAYSTSYREDYTSATASSAATSTYSVVNEVERLVWAVIPGSGVVRDPLPVSFGAVSSAWVAPASSATVTPTYPADDANDLIIATLAIKPNTATVATPANWTAGPADDVGTGTQGAGTGACTGIVFRRVSDGSLSGGSQAFTITGGSSPVGVMHAWKYDSTGFTDPQWAAVTSTIYSRTTGSTTFGGTGAANLDLEAGDVLGVLSISADDQSSTHTISAVAATGCTFGTVTQSPNTTVINAQGNDISAAFAYATVLTGPSSGPPSATIGGSSSETGGVIFYRIRATGVASAVEPSGPVAATGPAHTASLAGTISLTGTVAATGPQQSTAIPVQVRLSGTVASTSTAHTASATAVVSLSGTVSATGPTHTASSTGTVSLTGTVAATGPAHTASIIVPGEQISGTIAATGPAPTTAIPVQVRVNGTVAGTSAVHTASATALVSLNGTAAVTGPIPTTAIPGAISLTGTVAATGPAHTASIFGGQLIGGTVAATGPAHTASSAGTVSLSGTTTVTGPIPTTAIPGSVRLAGAVAATSAAQTASLSGSVAGAAVGSVAAVAPNPTGSAAGQVALSGTVAATGPAHTASLTGVVLTPAIGTVVATGPAPTTQIVGGQLTVGTITAVGPGGVVAVAVGQVRIGGPAVATGPQHVGAVVGQIGLFGGVAVSGVAHTVSITGETVTYAIAVFVGPSPQVLINDRPLRDLTVLGIIEGGQPRFTPLERSVTITDVSESVDVEVLP